MISVNQKIEGSSNEFFNIFLQDQIVKKRGYFYKKIEQYINETINKIKEMQKRIEQEIDTYFSIEKREIEKDIKKTFPEGDHMKQWQTKAEIINKVF